MNGRDWVSAMLEAMRRRRSIAAEAFRATLAEFPGVLVQVEPLNADAERDGLRRDALQADVETALREAGMAADGAGRTGPGNEECRVASAEAARRGAA